MYLIIKKIIPMLHSKQIPSPLEKKTHLNSQFYGELPITYTLKVVIASQFVMKESECKNVTFLHIELFQSAKYVCVI